MVMVLGAYHDLAVVVHGLGDGAGHVADGDLVLLTDREDDGVRGVVGAHGPDDELGQIARVDELPQRGARTPDGEGRAVLLRQVALVDQPYGGGCGARSPSVHGGARLLGGGVNLMIETPKQTTRTGDYVAVLDVEVVVRAVDVGGDNGGEVAPVLLLVAAVQHVDHALGVSVA